MSININKRCYPRDCRKYTERERERDETENEHKVSPFYYTWNDKF